MEGKGGGVYPQRRPPEECLDGDLGLGVHSLRILPVEKGERTTIKMAAQPLRQCLLEELVPSLANRERTWAGEMCITADSLN